MRKETEERDRKIRELLPIGKEIRMKEILDKVKAKRICSPNAVERRLIEWEKKGFVKKRIVSPKKVYYRSCEDVRLEKLIDDFLNEIKENLRRLPGEYSDIKKQLIEGSLTRAAGEGAVEVLRSEPSFLKTMILTSLDNKILALLNANLPEKRKGKFCYKRKLVHVDAATSTHLPV
jgi:DNA-binding HxlR family transcriptional regulator